MMMIVPYRYLGNVGPLRLGQRTDIGVERRSGRIEKLFLRRRKLRLILDVRVLVHRVRTLVVVTAASSRRSWNTQNIRIKLKLRF